MENKKLLKKQLIKGNYAIAEAAVKKAEEEIGIKNVIVKFKLECPHSPYVNLILEDTYYRNSTNADYNG